MNTAPLPKPFRVEATDNNGIVEHWDDDNYMVANNRYYRLKADARWGYVRLTSAKRGVLMEAVFGVNRKLQ